MRKCSRCKKEKEDCEFRRKSDGNTRNPCNDCLKLYSMDYYQKNIEKYRSYNLANNSKNRQKRRDWLNELKNKPCTDCGGEYHPYVMEFDHVRGKKIERVAKMLWEHPPEIILLEIAKCDLVCANCHRLRTLMRYYPNKNRGN